MLNGYTWSHQVLATSKQHLVYASQSKRPNLLLFIVMDIMATFTTIISIVNIIIIVIIIKMILISWCSEQS